MAFFVVNYHYVNDGVALDRVRPEHRRFLSGLAEEGLLVASGPVDQGDPQALLIFNADSVDQIDSLLADDPFRTAGLIKESLISAWSPVIGIFADQL